jgi:hypothetical protein
MAGLGPLSDLAPAVPTAAALGALRSVAEAAGRDDFSPLWAGQSFPLAKPMSAAALMRCSLAQAPDGDARLPDPLRPGRFVDRIGVGDRSAGRCHD